MTTDLFLTAAWFELLRTQGLERPPHALQALELTPARAGGEPPRLCFMRPTALGGWSSLSNYYSGLYGPVGEVAHLGADEWAGVARQLRRWPGAGVFGLQPLDAQSEWLPQLEQGWRQAGYRTWREPAFGNWYQAVEPGRFAAYWQTRPSALRHTVERGRRRLDRAGDWRIEVLAPSPNSAIPSGTDVQRMTDAYLSVYARSWKPQEPNPAFMPGLIRLAASQGCLRLGVLWLHGDALAAQLWLVYPGRSAQIFKLAHVRGQEKWSAGSVLTAALAQRAIDADRVRELDFLSGDDAYKADWMNARRERVRLLACDMQRLTGWLAWGRHGLGLLFQRMRRAGRSSAAQ